MRGVPSRPVPPATRRSNHKRTFARVVPHERSTTRTHTTIPNYGHDLIDLAYGGSSIALSGHTVATASLTGAPGRSDTMPDATKDMLGNLRSSVELLPAYNVLGVSPGDLIDVIQAEIARTLKEAGGNRLKAVNLGLRRMHASRLITNSDLKAWKRRVSSSSRWRPARSLLKRQRRSWTRSIWMP